MSAIRLVRHPALVLLAVLVIACSGDKSPASPTATLFPQLEDTPGPTAIPPPLPTPAAALAEPPSLAWLVDVRDGSVEQIFQEPHEDAIRYTAFDAQQAVLGVYDPEAPDFRLDAYRFDLDGDAAGVEPWAEVPGDASASYHRWARSWFPGDPICSQVEGGIEYLGRVYAGVDCGPVSPDGRWMLYRVDTGPTESVDWGEDASWDEWLLDLETGETRLLQARLEICLGDSFFSPQWSPRSRYVVFGDCAEERHIFLGDALTGTARVLVRDLPTFRNMPDWSRDQDSLIYPDGNGGTILEDLAGGAVAPLPLPWPARFDETGRYVYAPVTLDEDAPPETLVYNVATGETDRLPGEALYRRWPLWYNSATGDEQGYLIVLHDAPDCAGATLYRNGSPVVCVPGGEATSFSPDAGHVALAQRTRLERDDAVYALVVVETAGGGQNVVVNEIRSDIPYPRPVPWNEAGTHIIVHSPHEYGPYGP